MGAMGHSHGCFRNVCRLTIGLYGGVFVRF